MNFERNSLSWFVETESQNGKQKWIYVVDISKSNENLWKPNLFQQQLSIYAYHLFAELNSSNATSFTILNVIRDIGVDSLHDRICLCYWEKTAETNRIFWATKK